MAAAMRTGIRSTIRSTGNLLSAVRPAMPILGGVGVGHRQQRWLNIHEYHAHQLMQKYGITTPKGQVAESVVEAFEAAAHFPQGCVVKAQVLAGGRGKGHFSNGFKGGVHVASTVQEAGAIARKMLGSNLITKQTGADGRPCSKVLLVEKVKVVKELYLAIVLDRTHNGPVILASKEGGMDIEAVAAKNPAAIISRPIDLEVGLSKEAALEIANALDLGESAESAADQIIKLYKLFVENDSTSIEINPLGVLDDGRVMFMDAKFNFDDNAAFRQRLLFELRDTSQENPLDVIAHKADLNFIGLDGTIGCLVNGAGLAMATMDIIQLHGGTPANFLDVGGGATTEQVQAAFELITSDPKVNCIFVNIFGGIMRCDVIAAGIINAARKLKLSIPVIVRLRGTKRDEAKLLLATSGLDLISRDDLDEAATVAVSISKLKTLADSAGLDITIRVKQDTRDFADILTGL